MTTVRRVVTVLVSISCCAGIATAAVAQPKDIDGKRSRARKATPGKTIQDKLGAGDRADWRYVRVEAPGTLSISLKLAGKEDAVSLRVHDSKGKLLVEGESETAGLRVVKLSVSSGIYYIEVIAAPAGEGRADAGSGTVPYTLEMKLGR